MRFFRMFVCLSLLLPSGAWIMAQPGLNVPSGNIGVDFNKVDEKGKRDGNWIRVYKNKPQILYYRGNYAHGIPIGDWEFYDQEGYLMSKVNHVKDTTINDVVFYYKEGGIMGEGRFMGKVVDKKWTRLKSGEWKYYHSNQKISSIENYKDGKKHGNSKVYNAAGQLLIDENFDMGVKHGLVKEWNEKGMICRDGKFEKGKFTGDFTAYFENGKIKEKGSFYNDEFDKTWKFYDENGSDKSIFSYDKGKLTRKFYVNMEVEEFYDSGIPKLYCTYERGKRQGPFKEFYDVGKYVVIDGTEEERQMGIVQKQQLVGTVASKEGEYLDDQYEGDIIFRKKDGTVDHIETWHAGKMIKTTAKGN
jgi:uncharacterized protein